MNVTKSRILNAQNGPPSAKAKDIGARYARASEADKDQALARSRAKGRAAFSFFNVITRLLRVLG